MPRIILKLAGACALAAAPAMALAVQPGWYVALDGGQTHYTGPSAAVRLMPPVAGWHFAGPPTAARKDDTDAGYRLTVGYQLDAYFGVEAGYARLGTAKASGQGAAAPGCSPGAFCLPLVALVNGESRVDARGFEVAATGTLPLSPQWSLFARLGAFAARTRFESSGLPGPPEVDYRSSTDWKPTYGVGASWSPVDHWALRVDWDRYVHLGDRDTIGRYNVNLLSAGVVYSF